MVGQAYGQETRCPPGVSFGVLNVASSVDRMNGMALAAVVHWARDLAQTLLLDLPQRWRHTIAVARRAEDLAWMVEPDDDPDMLLAAAWLHDIGYARAVIDTRFHPLDGAGYLRRHGWPPRTLPVPSGPGRASRAPVADQRGRRGRAPRGRTAAPLPPVTPGRTALAR